MWGQVVKITATGNVGLHSPRTVGVVVVHVAGWLCEANLYIDDVSYFTLHDHFPYFLEIREVASVIGNEAGYPRFFGDSVDTGAIFVAGCHRLLDVNWFSCLHGHDGKGCMRGGWSGNVDGIYNGPPSQPGSEVIRTVEHGRDLSDYIQTEKSGFGRGGMLTKSSIARKVADEGIAVYIANGKKDNILIDIVCRPETTVSTCFLPSNCEVSNMKKWIAHSDGFAKGEVYIDDAAVNALRGERAVSLLPVGVTAVKGEFEKDDIVRIFDSRGHHIGIGRVGCDSTEAKESIGLHGKKPLVHYDYLYLE